VKQDTQMDALLNCGNVIRGYVYQDGKRKEYWFDGEPQNIASFLMLHGEADRVVLTDMMDMLVLNTYGFFIDSCPDKELLEKVKEHLIPMQMGMTEPQEIYAPTEQEANAYCNQRSSFGMKM